MRTQTSTQRIAFNLVIILIPFVVFVTGAHSVTAQCPPKMVENALGECVLTGTLTLSTTLTLESNTTLNCQSHRIVPQKQGGFTPATPNTPAKFTRSLPEVAIFLNGAQNVQIKNCDIDKFDFGIFAINGKLTNPGIPTPQILHNTIRARFVGISLMSVDRFEVRGNILVVTKRGGRGIYVGRDSDRNRILNNEIGVRVPPGDTTPVFRVPGPESHILGLGANPPVADGSAVLITQLEGPEPTLLNAIIEGTLFQLTVTDSAEPNILFTGDNIFDGNTIRVGRTLQMLPLDGVVLSLPQGTQVSNNTIIGARVAVRVGVQSGPPPTGARKQFPGGCSLLDPKPNPAQPRRRACLVLNDCNISGYGNLGECLNVPPPQSVFWVTRRPVIQDNLIVAPFDFGIATTGRDTVITGNTITTPTSSSRIPAPGTGIRLIGPFAFESTTVTRNTVRNIATALNLVRTVPSPPGTPPLFATSFSAGISVNDFTGYTTAVQTSGDHNQLVTDTELSALSELVLFPRGNFWGRDCSIGLAANKVIPGNIRIKDSHPFGVLVVRTPGLTPCQ